MRIEEDVKLDFKDVLIRPKRSTLASRKEVDVRRQFVFRWSEKTFDGVPVIAANMDGVGTIAMVKTFESMGHDMTVALHKHYKLEDLLAFYKKHGGDNVWYSIGVTEADEDKLNAFIKKSSVKIDKLCIDVANGYSEPFADFVKKMRTRLPDVTIMAGNVVTGEMVEELILSGADV